MDVNEINIDTFSIDEILDLFNLKKPVTRGEINIVANNKISSFKSKKTKELLLRAKKKLIDFLNKNNIESIFGETNNLEDLNKPVQKEIGYKNTDELVLSEMNPIKRRIQTKIIVINTKDRELFVTTKCKNIDKDGDYFDKNSGPISEFEVLTK